MTKATYIIFCALASSVKSFKRISHCAQYQICILPTGTKGCSWFINRCLHYQRLLEHVWKSLDSEMTQIHSKSFFQTFAKFCGYFLRWIEKCCILNMVFGTGCLNDDIYTFEVDIKLKNTLFGSPATILNNVYL